MKAHGSGAVSAPIVDDEWELVSSPVLSLPIASSLDEPTASAIICKHLKRYSRERRLRAATAAAREDVTAPVAEWQVSTGSSWYKHSTLGLFSLLLAALVLLAPVSRHLETMRPLLLAPPPADTQAAELMRLGLDSGPTAERGMTSAHVPLLAPPHPAAHLGWAGALLLAYCLARAAHALTDERASAALGKGGGGSTATATAERKANQWNEFQSLVGGCKLTRKEMRALYRELKGVALGRPAAALLMLARDEKTLYKTAKAVGLGTKSANCLHARLIATRM
jgi:hypothetical protein